MKTRTSKILPMMAVAAFSLSACGHGGPRGPRHGWTFESANDHGIILQARDVVVRPNLVSIRFEITNTTPLVMGFQTDWMELTLPDGQVLTVADTLGVRMANTNMTAVGSHLALVLPSRRPSSARADFVAPPGVNFLQYPSMALSFHQVIMGTAGGLTATATTEGLRGTAIALRPMVIYPIGGPMPQPMPQPVPVQPAQAAVVQPAPVQPAPVEPPPAQPAPAVATP